MRLLVIGGARSGTTWVAVTLGTTPGAQFLMEPDNGTLYPFAVRATRGMGSMPYVRADHPGPRDLRRLWDVAFGAPVHFVRGQHRVAQWLYAGSDRKEQLAARRFGDPRVTPRLALAGRLAVPRNLPGHPRHRVVKTVCAHFMLDWLVANWVPTVVVCRRHPMDALASRIEMGYGNPTEITDPRIHDDARERYGVPYPSGEGAAAQMAWVVGLQMSVLDDALLAHPELHVIDHEDLCADPVARFRLLAADLGLEWTGDDDARLRALNRLGTGSSLYRVAADVPGRWKDRLPADDARAAARVIARFPVAARYDLAVPAT